MLDAGRLRTLRAVLDHGSFSAAGDAVGLTQPAVSRQVSQLERQAGTQLVRRTRQGVLPTEAGRLLAGHADAILGRLALAEAELAELAGLRRGSVRLGSFFTALVVLSAEVAAVLEARHPELFDHGEPVIRDELVDRAGALRGLAAGELDVAIVSSAEAAAAPDDVELVPLFRDPVRVLLPSTHPLAGATELTPAQLAAETWVRAHEGTAARLVDGVIERAGLAPPVLLAGHGDEPVETQAVVAAGRGVTLAYDLNVLLRPDRIAVVPLAGDAPARIVQAAIMREQRARAARAVLSALRDVGRRRGA